MFQQNLLLIGFALIMLGFILVFAASFLGAKDSSVKTNAAFVGFIGPFPIGLGTDRQTLYLALAIGVAIFIIAILANFITRP